MDNPIQEIEHENLILGKKLIELYEDQIATLKAENETLKAQLTTVPTQYNPISIKPTLRTLSQIRHVLERNSSKALGIVDEKAIPTFIK